MAIRSRRTPLVRIALCAAVSILTISSAPKPAGALDPDQTFAKWTKVVSIEAAFAYFGAHLNNQHAIVQAWNLSGRFSLVPFGVTRFNFLGGALDGAAEIGLEPTFERFETERQNFAGLGLHLRYNLIHFRWGPLIPWIDALIAPGGSDLRIGTVSNGTRLTGPFMDEIQAGIGESYFVSDNAAIYAGLQAQHFSNGGFNGGNRNFSLNTPAGLVIGVSWYLP